MTSTRHVILLLACLSTAAGAEEFFAPDLEARKDDWEEMATGDLITIRGRLTLKSPMRVLLKGLSMHVIPDDAFSFPKLPDKQVHAIVRGRIRIRNRRAVFVANFLESAPTEAEVFRNRRAKLDRDDPDAWFALASWATRQAAFYDEAALFDLAKSARKEGIYLARSKLDSGDLAAIRKLANRARTELNSDRDADSLLHAAYIGFWKQTPGATITDDILFKLNKDLPGDSEAMTSLTAEEKAEYLAEPVKVYDAATDPVRKSIHRVMQVEMAREMLTDQLQTDFLNGGELASRIDMDYPELKSLATAWRNKWLDSRLSTDIKQLSDEERALLEEDLKTWSREDDARSLRRKWVDDRVRRLKLQGPDGFVMAADIVRRLDDETGKEVQLLKFAWKQNPDLPEVTTRLRALGYRLRKGRWYQEGDPALAAESEVQSAIREGRILPGMSPDQVEQSQGKASSVSRIATDAGVTLVWVYGEPGQTRTVVHFRQSPIAERSRVLQVSVIDP